MIKFVILGLARVGLATVGFTVAEGASTGVEAECCGMVGLPSPLAINTFIDVSFVTGPVRDLWEYMAPLLATVWVPEPLLVNPPRIT
jgi:hypothetical protein